ncbi:hypothetical protein BC440_06670 [Thalassospira sp. MIT1004]|nr:hypothetical protein [Thalassospira sp.]OHZ01485.1 hypothetical protein BC440_06670 [Thalassospira sp. MIT1004]
MQIAGDGPVFWRGLFRGKSDFTTTHYIYVFAKDGRGGVKGRGYPFCAVQNADAVVLRLKRLFSAVG